VKTISIAILLIVMSTLLALGVGELVVRVALSDVTTTNDNSSYFSIGGRQMNPPRKNSLGFREREIVATKTPGKYRIAVIGDSYTYGQGIAEEQRYTNIVEAHLNSSSRSYEVLNFGRPGAETVDHIEFLQNYVVPLKPVLFFSSGS